MDRYGLKTNETKEREFLELYLQKFKVNDIPEIIFNERKEKIEKLSFEIITLLKEKELTYTDAYVTLEYVYKILKVMSEYTHL